MIEPVSVSTVFPAVAPSAGSARRFVRAALLRWEVPPDVVETALLLASELVTNSYRHADSQARVSVTRRDEAIRVEVHDSGAGEVHLRAADVDALDGRGLRIVEALAHRWGTDATDRGRMVWFEVLTDAR
jgi:anti-sigma regulatory factor (Ser/Thr protein kinase)